MHNFLFFYITVINSGFLVQMFVCDQCVLLTLIANIPSVTHTDLNYLECRLAQEGGGAC
jgi:hypothetical protein